MLPSEQELTFYMDESKGYTKGGVCGYTHIYPELIPVLWDSYEVSPDKVLLLDHELEGEVCIYINGKWSGYVSEWESKIFC